MSYNAALNCYEFMGPKDHWVDTPGMSYKAAFNCYEFVSPRDHRVDTPNYKAALNCYEFMGPGSIHQERATKPLSTATNVYSEDQWVGAPERATKTETAKARGGDKPGKNTKPISR
jgi:hypothetical protein